MKITGLEELQRKLDQLRQNAEKMDGEHQVPLPDLFPPAFMRHHSRLADFETFCREGGLDLSSAEAFAATPPERLDHAVQRLTSFASWEEMRDAAVRDWANRRLFDGVER